MSLHAGEYWVLQSNTLKYLRPLYIIVVLSQRAVKEFIGCQALTISLLARDPKDAIGDLSLNISKLVMTCAFGREEGTFVKY